MHKLNIELTSALPQQMIMTLRPVFNIILLSLLSSEKFSRYLKFILIVNSKIRIIIGFMPH